MNWSCCWLCTSSQHQNLWSLINWSQTDCMQVLPAKRKHRQNKYTVDVSSYNIKTNRINIYLFNEIGRFLFHNIIFTLNEALHIQHNCACARARGGGTANINPCSFKTWCLRVFKSLLLVALAIILSTSLKLNKLIPCRRINLSM